MQRTHTYSSVHPMIIFWLGLLTGAIIVGLIFLYKVLDTNEFKTSTVQLPKINKTTEIQKKMAPTAQRLNIPVSQNTNPRGFGDGPTGY